MAVDAGLRGSVVGLGYVGLPLAVGFGRSFDTVGFHLSRQKVESSTEDVFIPALEKASGKRWKRDLGPASAWPT